MNKFTHLSGFLGYLFDTERSVEKAQAITVGILQARSYRLSDIAREITGKETANYKCIQRYVADTALKSRLLRLYQEEAPFLIGGYLVPKRRRPIMWARRVMDKPAVIGC